MDVSTIIVSYNTRELTRTCLASVFEKTHGVDFEVIVVDNASEDGSAAMIRESFPKVMLIESSTNLGFAAANNVAFKRAKGKYFFLLNPDTVLLNNAIRMFYEFMEDGQNQQVAAVGGYLLDEQRRVHHSYGEFVSLREFGLDAAGIRFTLKRGARNVLMALLGQRLFTRLARVWRRPDAATSQTRLPEAQASATSPRKVDYVTGADLFLRKSVLDEVGVFDERFFLYAEEMDLQYRTRKAGYASLVIPGPEIVHFETQSIGRTEKHGLLEPAKLEFLRKHSPLKYAACRLAGLRSSGVQARWNGA